MVKGAEITKARDAIPKERPPEDRRALTGKETLAWMRSMPGGAEHPAEAEEEGPDFKEVAKLYAR